MGTDFYFKCNRCDNGIAIDHGQFKRNAERIGEFLDEHSYCFEGFDVTTDEDTWDNPSWRGVKISQEDEPIPKHI